MKNQTVPQNPVAQDPRKAFYKFGLPFFRLGDRETGVLGNLPKESHVRNHWNRKS